MIELEKLDSEKLCELLCNGADQSTHLLKGTMFGDVVCEVRRRLGVQTTSVETFKELAVEVCKKSALALKTPPDNNVTEEPPKPSS